MAQLAVAVGPVVTLLQVTSTQPFVLSAVCGVQAATRVGPVLTVLHIVVVKPLPEFGPIGVQLAEPTTFVAGVQTVSVQALPDAAGTGVQEATAVWAEVVLLHVVDTKLLPALATAGVHDADGVGPVSTGAAQVCCVQPFEMLAAAGEQLAVSVGPVAMVLHVVSTQELPLAAVTGEHEATGVGPRMTSTQFVVV